MRQIHSLFQEIKESRVDKFLFKAVYIANCIGLRSFPLFIEELQRRLCGLDSLVALRMPILVSLSFIGKN